MYFESNLILIKKLRKITFNKEIYIFNTSFSHRILTVTINRYNIVVIHIANAKKIYKSAVRYIFEAK